jgi:hypothetical protein
MPYTEYPVNPVNLRPVDEIRHVDCLGKHVVGREVQPDGFVLRPVALIEASSSAEFGQERNLRSVLANVASMYILYLELKSPIFACDCEEIALVFSAWKGFDRV